MWKQFYAAIKQLLLLTHQTDENREQIKELRHQVREFASAIERLAYEVRRIDESGLLCAQRSAGTREPQLTSGECAAKVDGNYRQRNPIKTQLTEDDVPP